MSGSVGSVNQSCGHNGSNNIGIILVLFILLVIIACTCLF